MAAMARQMGLAALLGPVGQALVLIISRVPGLQAVHPSLVGRLDGADLDVAGPSTDDIYAALDWLASRKDAIEAFPGPHPRPLCRMSLLVGSGHWPCSDLRVGQVS
jgi:hypothetical protein